MGFSLCSPGPNTPTADGTKQISPGVESAVGSGGNGAAVKRRYYIGAKNDLLCIYLNARSLMKRNLMQKCQMSKSLMSNVNRGEEPW